MAEIEGHLQQPSILVPWHTIFKQKRMYMFIALSYTLNDYLESKNENILAKISGGGRGG